MDQALRKNCEDEYLTPEQLTQRYKKVVTLRTLANWRSTGDGPQYTKIGGRVLYAMSAVLEWESTRRIGAKCSAFLIMAGWADDLLYLAVDLFMGTGAVFV